MVSPWWRSSLSLSADSGTLERSMRDFSLSKWTGNVPTLTVDEGWD
jgi:hypothetical protein